MQTADDSGNRVVPGLALIFVGNEALQVLNSWDEFLTLHGLGPHLEQISENISRRTLKMLTLHVFSLVMWIVLHSRRLTSLWCFGAQNKNTTLGHDYERNKFGSKFIIHNLATCSDLKFNLSIRRLIS